MSNIDYTNSVKLNYDLLSKNKTNKVDKFTSWNFSEISNFFLNNKKQICLILLVFIIIFVIEKITFYNSLLFASPSVIPGITNNIKNMMNNSKNNNEKNDKKRKK
jgi:hypothetical protein